MIARIRRTLARYLILTGTVLLGFGAVLADQGLRDVVARSLIELHARMLRLAAR